MRKSYIPPCSEVVGICKDICETTHPVQMSQWTDGHGGGGSIGEDTGDGDAKEYSWDLWSNFGDDDCE